MNFNLEPCKRDKRGRNVADYRIRDHYEKLAEEMFEAHERAVLLDEYEEALELLHVMTVCASRLATMDLSEERLADIQQAVIEHNRERGYFKENDHEASTYS